MKTNLLIITALESELERTALPSGVNIVYSGVGKINAAITSYQAIQEFNPQRVVNFGTAGGVNPQVNGLLEITKVLQRDMETEPLAPRGRTPFCPKPHEYFSLGGTHICGSGDSFVTDHDPWLREQGVDVVDMELFAIAASAYHFGVPWQSFKYITDNANKDSAKDWTDKVNHGQEMFLLKLKELI